jgi:hypothetical protein
MEVGRGAGIGNEVVPCTVDGVPLGSGPCDVRMRARLLEALRVAIAMDRSGRQFFEGSLTSFADSGGVYAVCGPCKRRAAITLEKDPQTGVSFVAVEFLPGRLGARDATHVVGSEHQHAFRFDLQGNDADGAEGMTFCQSDAELKDAALGMATLLVNLAGAAAFWSHRAC